MFMLVSLITLASLFRPHFMPSVQFCQAPVPILTHVITAQIQR